jgi:hypothetical protein
MPSSPQPHKSLEAVDRSATAGGSVTHSAGSRCGSFRTATVRERPLCDVAALWSGPSLALGVLKEPPELSHTRHPLVDNPLSRP